MEPYKKPALTEAEQARLKVLEAQVQEYARERPGGHFSLPPHPELGDTIPVFGALFESLKKAGYGVRWNADNIEIDVPR